MPFSKTAAMAWVMTATFSCRVPSDGTGTSSCIRMPQPSSSNHSTAGSSAAPVWRASSAGPATIRVRAPKNSTSIPRSVRSRSAGRQTGRPSRRRLASVPNAMALPPPLAVSGSTSMPRLSR